MASDCRPSYYAALIERVARAAAEAAHSPAALDGLDAADSARVTVLRKRIAAEIALVHEVPVAGVAPFTEVPTPEK